MRPVVKVNGIELRGVQSTVDTVDKVGERLPG